MGAGLAVGIMCLPIVISLSEDALRAVPRALREGAYGLGASKFETSTKVVVPAAVSMTGFIVKVYTGDAEHGSVEYYSAYAVAATLFVITLGITIMGNMVQKRFREKYD